MIIMITYASLAQLVEHFTRNEGVAGSSPAWSLRWKPVTVRVAGFFSSSEICLKNGIDYILTARAYY